MSSVLRASVLLALALPAVAIAATAPVARLQILAGEVCRLTEAGRCEPLPGDALLHAGDRVRTSASGHALLRFADKGMASLRPGTTLHVQAYDWHPLQPERNRVRLDLEAGTARLVTGEAGQANKSGYRVNTPAMAIGIRGTDFLVQADRQLTRVLVQSGAISLAPFGAGCSLSGFGPCETPLARQLTAAQAGAFLEARGMAAPVLRQLDARAWPGLQRSLPGEPEAAGAATPAPDTAPVPESSASLRGGPATAVEWGRWSGKPDAALLAQGLQLVGHQQAFALYRVNEPVNLPATGEFSFTPRESAAFADFGGNNYFNARLSDLNLAVNFATRAFHTGLTWAYGNQSERFGAAGTINADGLLVQDPARSNMSLIGALNGNGSTAVYIFEADTATGAKASGGVRWSR